MTHKIPVCYWSRSGFDIKVILATSSGQQATIIRDLKPSDSERQIYFNWGFVSVKKMYEPNILPSKWPWNIYK